MAYLFSNHSFSPPIFRDESAYSSAEDHYEGWKYKFIDYWSSYDTLFWLLSELYKLQVQNPASLKLEHFVHTRGCDLKRFSVEDFQKIIPQYGEMLYHQLQMKLRSVTDEVWRREMVGHHMSPPCSSVASPSSSSAPHEHFNTSYFDQPIFPPQPHHTPSTTSTSDQSNKHWPTDRPDYDSWTHKSVMEWTPSDTLDCIIHELFQLNVNPANVNLDHFREVFGRDLVKMTVDDFKWVLPEYGELIYHKLQPKVKSSLSEISWRGTFESQVFSNQNISQPVSLAHRRELPYAHPTLDHGYNSETSDEMPNDQDKDVKEKRKPGRPRSLSKKEKTKGKVGRVWEFIRDLIMDPRYNPSVISWEDREKGLFRFRSGDQVAKLWGCKRGNPRMNFENFSRSIRQNYKKGYLLPVEKIRLVYQFGPRSTGWRPGDPPTRPITLPPATATTILTTVSDTAQ